MAQHVKILGVLHIVLGSLGVIAAMVIMLVFGGIAALVPTDMPPALIGAIGMAIVVVLLALSVPGLIIGVGLLQFRPWARIAGIIISALDLIHVPFGTALGIYGLWVLLTRETEQLFGLTPARVA
jgi:hypothetical protein